MTLPVPARSSHYASLILVAILMPKLLVAEQPAATSDQPRQNDVVQLNRLTTMLAHMPTNTDQRCIGIAGVAEALLAGTQADGEQAASTIDTLAEQIFTTFRTEEQLELPARIAHDGQQYSLTDRVILDQLVTSVADAYKQHHARSAQAEAGVENLLAAEKKRVMTLAELDKLLAADPDQLEFFCCFGRRWFPDGSEKQTSHAVLLRRNADRPPTIFDPNDPAGQQEAKYVETENGLEVEWTCKYRDTGQTTTQRYYMVPKAQYFQTAFPQTGR